VGFLRPKSGLRKDMLGFMRYCEKSAVLETYRF